ncbi:alkaline phosphatase [Vibrio astriarenae]|uniref:Alkaline phosphatase n=1 Tax=Vibrio astriarenae TaxID=1481923 RepID=A0A7Z2YDI6_9VIBR|nr:alkaline phosphatase [Vibrio astriarenae]QIA63199.1 alkaline phosphatase [Vibrio astriarenae]
MINPSNRPLVLSALTMAILAGCNETNTEYVDVEREIAESIDSGPYGCTDEELESSPNKDCRLYIKGSMNSWSAPPEAQFHYQGDDLHIALFKMEAGSYSFKISDPEWSAERDLAIGAEFDSQVTTDVLYELQRKYDDHKNQNMDIVVDGQDQIYKFSLDATSGINNPTLYIENVTEADVETTSSKIYLTGNFNEWDTLDSYAFDYVGAGNYQVTASFEQQQDIQFNLVQNLDGKELIYGALKNQLIDLKEGASALTTYPGGVMHASVDAGTYIFGISTLGDGQLAVPVSISKVRAHSGYDKLTTPNTEINIGADGSTHASSYDWKVDSEAVRLVDDARFVDPTFRQLATADSEGRYQVQLTTNKDTHSETIDTHEIDVVSVDEANNVILMIGDGMGYAQLDVTRAFKGEALFMDSAPHRGQIHTASADTLGYEKLAGLGMNYYTDSAAAATAMSTGVKVVSGTIAQARPGDGSDLETILEHAQKMGKSVGVVATSHCVHATPAAFVAHGPNRNDFAQLSDSMFGDVQPNLAICGSKQVKDVDVISQAALANDYTVVKNRTDMLEAINSLPAEDAGAEIKFAAIFGEDEIPYVIPSDHQQSNGWSYESLDIPHIQEMTEVAIDVLSRNPNGFFLMVEGSQIDFAGHINDEERLIHETLKFDDSVEAAVNWAESRSDTTVIVTADHETGGLELVKTNGTGEVPEVTWFWGNHTNVPVPMKAWGLNSDVVHGRSVDNTSVHSIMLGSMPAK